MSKVSVFDQKWLDLVFEGRNKEYGAYQLRQQDSKTTLIALFSAIALLGALVSIPVIVNLFKGDIVEAAPVEVLPDAVLVDAEKLFQPEIKKPDPIAQQPELAAPAPRPSESTTRHTALVATSDPVDTDPPTTTQLIETDPGNTTTQGSGQGIVIGPTSPDGPAQGTGFATEGTGTSEVMNMALLDEAPNFPGGLDKFLKVVGRQFITPEIGEETTLRVIVSFVIEKDGSMSSIKVTRDPGNGLGEEAVRVLKSIKTKWTPGKKKGQPVRTGYSLPILVRVR